MSEFEIPTVCATKHVTETQAVTMDYNGSRYELVVAKVDGGLSVAVTNLYVAVHVSALRHVGHKLAEKGCNPKDAQQVQTCIEQLLGGAKA